MAKAKIVESASEFLAVVEKSGLLSGDELESTRKICAGSEDPKIAARRLLSDGVLTNWQANQLLAGFAGLVMGKFGLLDVLSKNELGRVYLAKHLTLNQKFALHAISTKNIADPKRVERFLNDLGVVRTLEHPNLVRVTEFNSDRDRHVIVTEVISEDLQQRVAKSGPLKLSDAIAFITQAAEGVAHLHRNKVVHLDLTPANLAIDQQGNVKVREAGFAHLRNPSELISGDSSAASTARLYASPEVKGEQDVDTRADIYSLGGVLYFVLTGKAPFSVGSDEVRSTQQDAKLPLAITSIRSDVPSELERLCNHMLAASPAERPATIEDVVSELRSLSPAPTVVHQTEPPVILKAVQPWSEPAIAGSEDEFAETADVEDDANVDSEAIPDAELAGFKVKKKPRESPAVSHSATRTVAPDQVAKKQQKRMLLTIIGVASALLVLVTGGIIALMSMGSGKEVATKSTPVPVKDEPPPVTDPYGGGPPIVAVDAGLSTVAPSSALSSLTGTPPADASIPAASGTSSNALGTATTTATGAPVGQRAAGTTTSPPVPATEPKPAAATPPAPPAATPKPEESPKPEPKPADKPEAKPETKSGPEITPPKKDTPPARMFEIAAAVNLPQFPAADGFASESPNKVLGRINADPKAGCFISLLGGDTAMKGKTEFALRSAQGGTAPRDWEFFVREAADAETVLAKLSLPEHELLFEWTPEGVKYASAAHLQNCALRITVGQDKPYLVALRTPQSGVPLSLAILEKAPATFKFEIDSLPDLAAVQIEPKVTEIKMATEPPAAGDKNKGDQWLYLGEGGAQSLLHLRMATSSTPKGLQITLTPFLVLPKEKPQRLTPALRKSLSIGFLQEQEQRRMVENRIAELAKIPKDKQNPAEQDQLSFTKSAMDERIKKVQQFDEVIQKLGTAQLQLRIYHDVPDAPIDLVRPGSS